MKRDFRITDNECLFEAAQHADMVLPFFCWEHDVINEGDYSSFHLQAQWEGLSGICKSLRSRGIESRVVSGEIVEQLDLLFQLFPFDVLYSHQETGNLVTFQRDQNVQKWCREQDVQWVEMNPSSVMRGGDADRRRLKLRQADYRKQEPLPIPDLNQLEPLPPGIVSPPPSWKEVTSVFPKFKGQQLNPSLTKVNEQSAHVTLTSFLHERGIGYSGGISSPNTAFVHGSRLSSHLAWGTVSLRTVFAHLDQRRLELKARKELSPWLRSLRAFESRLFWRDHFIQRLEAFPVMEKQPLNSAYADLKYEDDPEILNAWINGRTGYPMVDACMRCLQDNGFLNFRMRAMVVSFACYGLHLSWRTIHEPLARLFHDYEPGIHLSQLQMQAGVIGFNAIRVYSPKKQFLDHDPNGIFVHRWVEELKGRTPAEIAYAEESALDGYNPKVVDLKLRAKEMKARVFEVRKSAKGKKITGDVLKRHGSKRSNSGRKKKTEKNTKGQMALFKTL
jgi:deoxyribodipyrimidine photo-lyase